MWVDSRNISFLGESYTDTATCFICSSDWNRIGSDKILDLYSFKMAKQSFNQMNLLSLLEASQSAVESSDQALRAAEAALSAAQAANKEANNALKNVTEAFDNKIFKIYSSGHG